MTTITETAHSSGFLLTEASGHRARDNGVLITGQNLGAGTVLGQISVGGATSAAKSGGNTGNGTLTMDVTNPVRTGAQVGVYSVRFQIAATNNGTFVVEDPNGNVIQTVIMAGGAGAVDDDLKFAIADGATDFIVGDGFDITVAAGSGKYTILAVAGQDGSQYAAGILLADTNATSADVACCVVTRACEVNSNELVWPAGISVGNKAIAIAQLQARNIILRT